MKALRNITLAIACALMLVPALAFAQDPHANGRDIVAYTSQHVTEITSINRDALFQNQYNWEAVENLDITTANDDGSLSVWQPGWYISHDWSDYGKVIAGLQPGDAVTVNGETTLILNRDEWGKDVTTDWDVFDAVGWEKTIFQTCLGDDALWIAYGVVVNPTPEFLATHAS